MKVIHESRTVFKNNELETAEGHLLAADSLNDWMKKGLALEPYDSLPFDMVYINMAHSDGFLCTSFSSGVDNPLRMDLT